VTVAAAAGRLVISSALKIDKTSVTAGDTLHGTVTYQNTSTIVAQAIAITSRPPGGTNAGGPFDALTPSLAAQTIQPGAILTLAASRAFTSADPLGAWYEVDVGPVVPGGAGRLARSCKRYQQPGFRRLLRSYQRDCLLRGKAAATRRLDERQAAQWRPEAAETATQDPPGREVSGRAG
jgi:uncharacterized repeat protein (TIGR01451 family)